MAARLCSQFSRKSCITDEVQGVCLEETAPSAGGLVKGDRVALIEGATLAVLSAEPHACKNKNREGRCEAVQHLLQDT